MVWNASGTERVKSYRLYQELEAKHNEALDHIMELQAAITFKDGLIRSLAAEIAMLPKQPVHEDIQHLYEEAADAASKSAERKAVRPGQYSVVQADEEAPTSSNRPQVYVVRRKPHVQKTVAST